MRSLKREQNDVTAAKRMQYKSRQQHFKLSSNDSALDYGWVGGLYFLPASLVTILSHIYIFFQRSCSVFDGVKKHANGHAVGRSILQVFSITWFVQVSRKNLQSDNVRDSNCHWHPRDNFSELSFKKITVNFTDVNSVLSFKKESRCTRLRQQRLNVYFDPHLPSAIRFSYKTASQYFISSFLVFFFFLTSLVFFHSLVRTSNSPRLMFGLIFGRTKARHVLRQLAVKSILPSSTGTQHEVVRVRSAAAV